MVDFGKIFNIVFVAACAALLVLLLVCAIVVAVKGKRKCKAPDVLLRILCVLVLIASAAMLTVSVLTMLSGGFRIEVTPDGGAAVLISGGNATELPMPQLFAALSSVLGFGLSAVLLILSLVALIVDCLVANKKSGMKKPVVQKTPEQLKREAELERIKKIGESAVRKTNSVAASEKTEKTEKSENAENAGQPLSADRITGDTQDGSDFDWRVAPEPAHEEASFVGIKDEQSDFDSFDTFDDTSAEESADSPYEEHEQSGFDDDVMPDDGTAETVSDEEPEYDYDEQTYEQDVADEQPVEADEAYDGQVDEVYDEQSDEVYKSEADGDTDEYGDEPVYDAPEQYGDIGSTDYETDGDGIEPDRGIYIPEIRTVTRAEPERAQKSAPAPKNPAAKKSAAKPKKPATKKQPQKPADNVPPEKRLPVTRRYVILDRHNAVNMFGEYLKERNQAEKDKLKSSINTIIIE